MKKIEGRKLALARETIIPLQHELLENVAGGQSILPRSQLCITDQSISTLTQTVRTLTRTIPQTLGPLTRPTRPWLGGAASGAGAETGPATR